MKDKKRTPELIALAVKLYDELKSTQKVAKRLELGASTTYRILKAAGVELPPRFSAEIQERKKTLHGDLAKQAADDYAAGMPLSEMHTKYGIGTWAIKTAARDHGVAMRSRGGRTREFTEAEQADIVKLYQEEGWSYGQIATKYNASVNIIRRLGNRLGIEVRGHRASGEKHGSWKGGRVKVGEYVAVLVSRDDPMFCMAHKTGYVLEHRLVMARAIGRPLTEHETVHHLDDDKENNDLSNLQLRFGKHGKGVKLKCRCCGSSDIVPVEL